MIVKGNQKETRFVKLVFPTRDLAICREVLISNKLEINDFACPAIYRSKHKRDLKVLNWKQIPFLNIM